MTDLVILVADKNMQFAMRGALARPEALGIRAVTHDFRPHPERDGGARTSGVDILALERRRFGHALLVFDLEGCGAEQGQSAEDLERLLDVLRWPQAGNVRTWLQAQGFVFDAHGKPDRPKDVIEALVRFCRLPRSSAQYEKITVRVSLRRCSDPAFGRLRTALQNWFTTGDR